MHEHAESLARIARAAGQEINAIYAQDFSVSHKVDASPLTQADLAAHRCIVAGLAALDAGIPILSEESAAVAWQERKTWSRYWLVDPLDGTREFVNKNGEFTVNIALIEQGRPVFGVVYAPVLDWLLIGGQGFGCRSERSGTAAQVRVSTAHAPLRVAASRSHRDPQTQAYLDKMGAHEALAMGSSLKFCKIASGELDLYPRFGPTSEWDTAAAHAVLEGAGGGVFGLDGQPLRYNHKDSLLNPHFIAVGDAGIDWQAWL
jgi:3'(2'), 5'-bisphosphate nucleotidase